MRENFCRGESSQTDRIKRMRINVNRNVWRPSRYNEALLLITVATAAHIFGWSVMAQSTVAPYTIPVTMNKVWPYNNPMETYSYYDALPVCHPGHVEQLPMTFGQIMRGDRLVNSLYEIKFLKNEADKVVCTKTMTEGDLKIFRDAIDQNYMFSIYVADLPVTKAVGIRTDPQKYNLVTHLNFNLGYNDGQVVSANVSIDESLADISAMPGRSGLTVAFRYSVSWFLSDISIGSRLHKQLAGALTPSTQTFDIHWLGIINSFVLVLFITSFFFLVILRIVRSDLSHYLRISDQELAVGVEEETGWKLLRADVFRPPPHRMWFCACVGSGAHIFLVAVTIVLVGCFSPYLEGGTVLSTGLFGYMLTSFIAGFFSANLYRRLNGEKWAWNIIITALMFMVPCVVVWSVLNCIALSSGSTAALPFGTASLFFSCWLFVTLPLTILGGIVGRQKASKTMAKGTPFPCKTNKLAREIPSVYWYRSPWIHVIVSALLPFSAIYIELHFIFVSLWGTKIYTLYGALLMAFTILLLVACTVSILLTYFHLNAEDHRWWWRSFFSGSSIASVFLLHSIYYFFTSTRMYGILQVTFFFGYSLILAFGIFLTMGFVTFTSTYIFVRYIYSSIKSD